MKPGWRIIRIHDGSIHLTRRIWRTLVPLDDNGQVRLTATCIRCAATYYAGNWALDTLHHNPAWTAAVAALWGVTAWRAQPLPQPATGASERGATCDDSGAEEAPTNAGKGMWIMADDPDNPARTTIQWTKEPQ